MRHCRPVDALFLGIAMLAVLAPTVGHVLLAAPVLAGVAGRAALRWRRAGRPAGTRGARRRAVWYATGVGT